jgi:hypothetical protein
MTTKEQRCWVKSMRIQVAVAGILGMVPTAIPDATSRWYFARDLDEIYQLAKDIEDLAGPKTEVNHADT